MSAFKSADAYRCFARNVKHSNRYVRSKADDVFLETLVREARTRVEAIPAGSILWRAQLGHEWEPLRQGDQHITDIPCPFPPERMKPLGDQALEGRANPKGIPYLYVSTERETALAEVCPWLGSRISIAQLKTQRELGVVNCTHDCRPRQFVTVSREGNVSLDIPPEDWDNAIWSDIDDAFSRPVTQSDNYPEYIPTQIIAELFKMHGFDGVAYRSSLGSGHNLVLFDLVAAVLSSCSLCEVKRLNFEFAECANPYVLEVKQV